MGGLPREPVRRQRGRLGARRLAPGLGPALSLALPCRLSTPPPPLLFPHIRARRPPLYRSLHPPLPSRTRYPPPRLLARPHHLAHLLAVLHPSHASPRHDRKSSTLDLPCPARRCKRPAQTVSTLRSPRGARSRDGSAAGEGREREHAHRSAGDGRGDKGEKGGMQLWRTRRQVRGRKGVGEQERARKESRTGASAGEGSRVREVGGERKQPSREEKVGG